MAEAVGSYSYDVQPFQVDFRNQLSLSNLGYFLFQTAAAHAAQRAFGIEDLRSNNKAWVLTRLRIELDRYPQRNEQLDMDTWVGEIGVIFTNRFFDLKIDGHPIGGASSSWALIDLASRRPERLDDFTGDVLALPERTTAVAPPQKIYPLGEQARLVQKRQVRYGDLDINQHVNSARYMYWMLDIFELDFFQAHYIERFEINYLSELHYGEQVDVLLEQVEDALYRIELRRGRDGHLCSRGELQARPRAAKM